VKILVIASPRSGGKYFTKSLADTYGLEFIHEPGRKKFAELPENVCVKVLPYKPYIFDKLDNLEKYTSRFDYIFLLSRKDKLDHLRSLWNMWEHSRNMHLSYFWDDKFFESSKLQGRGLSIEFYKEEIEELEKQIKNLSVKLGTEIIYYEDLYYNTEVVNLKGLQFIPDLSKKLRKTGKEKLTKLI